MLGIEFGTAGRRVEWLDEACQIMKQLFGQERTTFEGTHYALRDAISNPKPVQTPHPPILIGGAGEKRLLRVVAEHADIWNCPNNVATELAHKLDVLKQHCAAFGRDPASIEVSEQCIVVLGRTEKELRAKLQFAKRALGAVFDIDKTALRGTPEQLIEAIQARSRQGVTFFTMMFGDLNQAETLELFAEKVAPAFA